VAEQRGKRLLGEHRDPGARMALADGAQEGSGQENVADRTEAHGQNVRSGEGIGHGVKVQREW
jgi:hypothetical protein